LFLFTVFSAAANEFRCSAIHLLDHRWSYCRWT
jgi:hypothetical protein